MTEAVIVATSRTPIGRAFKGSLKDIRPDDLSAQVVASLIEQTPALDPTLIDDLYWGCAEPSGKHGSNMARVIAVLAGLDHLPAAPSTGSARPRPRPCGWRSTRSRPAREVFISGGSVRLAVHELLRRRGLDTEAMNPRFNDAQERSAQMAKDNTTWTDPRDEGLLPDIYLSMGQTAENVATSRGVSRQRQDEWGVISQNRAEQAIKDGFFEREITPVTLADGTVVSTDDGPRPGVTLEAVQGLNPVFRENGTITAGNCCPLNDGASGVVIMSDTKAKELGLTPLARIVSTGVSALSPEIMGLGPVEASKQALARPE